ncbi:MAG: RIP metalloprotease RseP [Gemmatimonadetes bacterium]|nr:RIP metalloprotease RseP [Gemmatimonadota bacterium]
MLITILATAVVLGVLILVHELGHFWAAKLVDIEVSRFSIGFGPKLVGFKPGETEYVISALPLGGYVKMEGMIDEEVTSTLEGGATTEHRQPSPRDFDAKSLWARFLVISAGVLMNLVFAFVAFSFIAHERGVHVPVVGEVTEGLPAAAAGILPGDLIRSVNGRRMDDAADVTRLILPRAGEQLSLTVERDGQTLEFEIIPAVERQWDEIARDTIDFGRIGVGFPIGEDSYRSLGVGESIVAGARETSTWVAEVVDFFARLLTGRRSPKELGGPIVIGQLSGQFARAGFWPLLDFMAIISVNLAVLNLLPIPVLDGGHLLFLAIEGLRGGKPVSVEQRLRFSQIGMLMVLGLMVWAFANDIMRLVGA